MNDKKLTALREKVRVALNDYRQAIINAQMEAEGITELDSLLVSFTQVQSAKRVLWLED